MTVSRRTWMILTGAGAAAAGIGWGLKRQGNASQTGAPAADAPGWPLSKSFWLQQFERPDGSYLDWQGMRGHPILLNFWASWCPPCVKEMPEIDRFHREFAPQGWKVVGLAIDGPTPVREFLAKVKVGFEIGLAGFGGTELAQGLGNTTGGLPFTVLIDAHGRGRQRKMGGTHFDELATWAREPGMT